MANALPDIPRYVIGEDPPPLPEDLLAILRECDTPMLGHICYWGHMDPGIRASAGYAPRTAGRALTVQCPGADSTMLHHAVGLAAPGDVLVIDRLGDRTYACLGDGVAAAAMRAGIVGAVIDGPCTDAAEMVDLGFPVWCRGASPVTTRMLDTAGTARRAVSVGGVAVLPGAAILADGSGVFALAPDEARRAAATALERARLVAERRRGRDPSTPLGEASGASARIRARMGEG